MTTIDKASTVLAALCASRPGSQLSTLERATRIPKPTLYRMLRNLKEHGLVAQDASGAYRPGPRVFTLAATTFETVSVDNAVRAVILRLGAETHLAVHVSILRGDDLIYVDKLEGTSPFQMRSKVGTSQAWHSSAIGKSVLAQMPPARARELLQARELKQFTAKTVTDPDLIMAQMSTTRARGYAIDNEEDESETRAIGVALLDDAGQPFGGISLVAPVFEISMQDLEGHAAALMDAAASVQSSGARWTNKVSRT